MTDLVEAPAIEDVGFRVLPVRRVVDRRPTVRFSLQPGDRILVAAGDEVSAGSSIAERQRDPQVEDGPAVTGASPADDPFRPGDWWPGDGHEAGSGTLRRRRPRTPAGELLHPAGSRWRIASGEHFDLLETPAGGVVRSAVAARGVELELSGSGIRGAHASGTPSRGRLERVPGESGLRGALDVGRAGSVLLVEGRVDSEAIIRARAMGVRGVIVPALAGKDLRDLIASEARQRASLQPLASFAVVVLEGASRRPTPGPIGALLRALEGREVALFVDPPLVAFEPFPGTAWAGPPAWVRIRAGELAGREARWIRSLGNRRFAAGVHLEAAAVALDDGQLTVVPLADLERFG